MLCNSTKANERERETKLSGAAYAVNENGRNQQTLMSGDLDRGGSATVEWLIVLAANEMAMDCYPRGQEIISITIRRSHFFSYHQQKTKTKKRVPLVLWTGGATREPLWEMSGLSIGPLCPSNGVSPTNGTKRGVRENAYESGANSLP